MTYYDPSEIKGRAQGATTWGWRRSRSAHGVPWHYPHQTQESREIAPEHKRLSRYPTLSLRAIKELPVETITEDTAHLYLWVPNALLAEGMQVMTHWSFSYKTNLIWYKVRKDGGPDPSWCWILL